MKKIALPLLLLFAVARAQAQQQPHYTQYLLNQYIINPALTGIENYTDIKFSHRHQWVGIEDAPVTSYVTIHLPLGKKDYRTTATSLGMEGENPRGKNYWEDYTAAAPHHGIGLQVINDRTGPLSNFSAFATYAYHIGISPRTSLAAGFGLGFSRLSLDAARLDIYKTSVDPAVYTNGVINRMMPDINAGLYLYSADYFIGLSAKQIIPQKIDFSNNQLKKQEGKTVPHLFATAGYRFLGGADFNVTPSIMVKYLPHLAAQVDLNTKIQYRDLVWLGGGYRLGDGFNGMFGLNLSHAVNASYSYDYTISDLGHYSRGTHEIVIGFVLGNHYDDSCPRNVW